ncbi:coenzyme F420-0:L-glutamate ligase [Alkaliphilus oremlandii]|uniref:Asparagine synthase (Glutamine-hydrolyzing) n=1 Tax=Alkaliphilus oremlandii (strain OhILAs) TaxID=350688 RepID=A8MJK2_ALKOO|nr:coenzyme F420-0:L-glutamate ligase [Alkaliphilus oremlandii]ABW19984.1 asparagine synthase (glutamine-hydrolyzing) [Alkaliphilus oremlandii OhILAs]
MDQPEQIRANEGKELEIHVNGKKFIRIPVKTHLIKREDRMIDVACTYLKDKTAENDIVFITEKIVGITQGRALPLSEIKPRPLAVFLAKYVTKTPAGIGLGMPETMEMALRECGTLRILFAAAIGAITKILFKRKGDFYRIAGPKARAIDGPTSGTIPPYNSHVVLGPAQPDKVAREISDALNGTRVVISDINDLGGNILGASHKDINLDEVVQILKDNPLGQGHQQTPMGIIRQI